MATPLLKRHQSALLTKSSESDCSPSPQGLPQLASSGDQMAPQPKANVDQKVPQLQMATFEGVKRFMEAIVFTKTCWPILSDDKYSMVAEAWKLAIVAQNHQWALAGTPAGIPSVCQLRSSPSLKSIRKNEKL
jgi:hypothetical protein